jgi:hypothetical protein
VARDPRGGALSGLTHAFFAVALIGCPFGTGSRDRRRRSRSESQGCAPARASSIPARSGACRGSS